MEGIKGWVITICAVVLLTTIITILVPNGRTSFVIKGVFSLLTTLIIISPICHVVNNGFSFNDFTLENPIEIQYDFVDYIGTKRAEEYKNGCEKILVELGVTKAEIEINYLIDENYNFSIKNAIVNLKSAVINSNSAHIDIIKDVKKSLSRYLSITESEVDVYE
ncbi:MAG: hypothetical protein IJZ73_06150 [Clostridia bacterium]|nr:hypothetical protein [Clostridia bacterium]